MKVGIKCNLPFRFVDEDEYQMSYQKVSVNITIKLVQNCEAAEKVMGMKISTVGEGAKVDMNADEHGLVNFTNVKMEIEDKSETTLMQLYDAEKISDFMIKKTVMQILNRLGEVVRHATNNYYIRSVNLRDVQNFVIADLSKSSPMVIVSNYPSHGHQFPNFNILEQSQVKEKINRDLIEETNLPTWKSLLLDAINFFTVARYNEAVIISNVVLESFIADHLYNKLNQKYPDKTAENKTRILRHPKSLHKIMKKHFIEIDGRKLKDNPTSWDKFDKIRRFIRPRAMHLFTAKVDPNTSFETIQYVREIMRWIDPSIAV